MKTLLPLLLSLATAASAADSARSGNTVILDDTGVKNLHIETRVVEESTFEKTVFALGRIDVYPGHRAVLSSRVPGRALEVFLKRDHFIKQGEVAAVIESRQPGNPPPRINLTAPLSGIVSKIDIVPGQPVEPTDRLAEILDLTEVYALARVPEHLAGTLKIGQKARIVVPAAPGRVFEAELEHLGTQTDTTSATLEAAFRVANPDSLLRPGMRAEFSLIVSRRENVTSVPRSALQGDSANRFVYVKDFDLNNAFIRTPVVTGETNDTSVEILSGLLPADEVVTTGAYSLAFAGGSGISLKEALDAAHGHEHNADGSEISPGSKKSPSHDAHEEPPAGSFWKIISGLLFVALLLSLLLKSKSRRHQNSHSA